jgi:hypothetical protein
MGMAGRHCGTWKYLILIYIMTMYSGELLEMF